MMDGVDRVHVYEFMACKFIGSVFSYMVNVCPSAGAVLARTVHAMLGKLSVCSFYMCFLCVFICVCMCLSDRACVAEGLNAPAPARAHP